MKTLSDYIDDKQTSLFKKTGAFFAFSKQQFDERKKEGVEYVTLDMGMICPQDNAKELNNGLNEIFAEGVAQDLAENGKKAIIHRELGNHEYSYTYDISDTIFALSGYGITEEEIRAEVLNYIKAHNAWEEAEDAKYLAKKNKTA